MSTETDAALRAAAEAARMWLPAEDHDGMDEVPWMAAEWWQSAGLDERHAAFAGLANPAAILDLLDRVERAEAKVARVEALADEWEAERDAPFGEAHMSHGYAQHQLRAALGDPR